MSALSALRRVNVETFGEAVGKESKSGAKVRISHLENICRTLELRTFKTLACLVQVIIQSILKVGIVGRQSKFEMGSKKVILLCSDCNFAENT